MIFWLKSSSLRQLSLRPLALGDVFLDGQKVGDFAGGVENRGNGGRLPIEFPVLFPVVKFPAPLPAGGDGLPQSLVIFGRHFARLQNARIFADGFLEGIARHFRELRVDIFDVAGLVGDDDGNRAVFNGARQFAHFLPPSAYGARSSTPSPTTPEPP